MTRRQRRLWLAAFFGLGLLLVWRDDFRLDTIVIWWLTVLFLGYGGIVALTGGLPESAQRKITVGLIGLGILWTLGCLWVVLHP